MPASPSPLYLLLTNPSWGNTSAYAFVLEGLEGDWQFDANEAPDGAALLPTLLKRWNSQKLPEAKLLPVVKHLLDRGADPGFILHEPATAGGQTMGWNIYGATKNLLQNASEGKDPARSQLAGTILNQLSSYDSLQAFQSKLETELSAWDGWRTQIDGLSVVPWIALQSCQEGAMTGWPSVPGESSADKVRKFRRMRHLALASKAIDLPDPCERFILACGMLLHSSYAVGYHSGECDASDALDKTAMKILATVPGEQWDDLIETIQRDARFEPAMKVRFGAALLRGLTWAIEDQKEVWAMVAKSIPMLYQNGKSVVDDASFGRLFCEDNAAPSEEFWDALPVDDIRHDALLRIMLGSYAIQRYGKEPKEARHEFLRQMTQWASRGDLTLVDIDDYKAIAQHYLKDDPAMVRLLDQYQIEACVMHQSRALECSTPNSSPRARARL